MGHNRGNHVADAHHHAHAHAPKDFGRAFAIGVTLNTVFIEAIFGYLGTGRYYGPAIPPDR